MAQRARTHREAGASLTESGCGDSRYVEVSAPRRLRDSSPMKNGRQDEPVDDVHRHGDRKIRPVRTREPAEPQVAEHW